MSCQKFHSVSGMVWWVLSNVVSRNGMSFHSTHATSQALQPMQVVVSMSLQTSTSRCVPLPGTLPGCAEMARICNVFSSNIISASLLHFLELYQESLEFRRVGVGIHSGG